MLVQWRIHLQTPPSAVYHLLSTDDGRARFWAEEAVEWDGQIEFRFPGGQRWRGRILAQEAPYRFSVQYFGGTTTTFTLQDDGTGGTDLLLTDEGIAPEDYAEVNAGWVSVLMALKAAVDFGVDLRNHDAERTWDRGMQITEYNRTCLITQSRLRIRTRPGEITVKESSSSASRSCTTDAAILAFVL